MRLNIYIVSHPIIKQLSSQIMNPTLISQNMYNESCKQLGSLMIYEVMRRWMTIQNIYIKQINHIQTICTLKKEESYIILTDLVDSYNFVTDALNLIPGVELQHISLKQKVDNDHNFIINTNYKKQQKIIIINLHIDNDILINFLDYLTKEKHVKITQIKIICVTCKHQLLEKIGNKYADLSIYTTKIL
uniref:uracil phosphoribosyltransferase n=1 Tax=Pachymeniopsis lanceolata TaxID=151733 RepID=UPI002A811562|nr:uracil phosphoribosyltransferase [Pachymeniopsis lanceolata]WOL37209.1 uracil phosphoribosyltransferase [Pachymeniopsis lanceolata]